MLRCPKCHRFGMESITFSNYKCIWSDCGERADYETIKKAKHPILFKKFIDSIMKKNII